MSDLVEKQGLYLIVWVCSADRTHIAPVKGFHLYCFETGSMLESECPLGQQEPTHNSC